MNRFAFGDALEYDAIVDRAQFVYFDPTPLEIHKNTALWFWDQEIFDFVGEHLHIIDPDKLSSRTYIKAHERKAKGDWKEFIARRYFTQSGEQWVHALESNPKYTSVDERVDEFIRRTGLGRSTYFNFKKALKSDGQSHRLTCRMFTLTGRPPDMHRTWRPKPRQRQKKTAAARAETALSSKRNTSTRTSKISISRTKTTMTQRRVSPCYSCGLWTRRTQVQSPGE